MQCQTCEALLGVYRHSVSLLTDAVQEIPRAGDEFWLAFAEVERLRLKCKEANNAMTAHRRQDHRQNSALDSISPSPVPTWKRTTSCQTCDDLLAAYKRSARDHTNFVLNVCGAGVMGDDIRLASQEAERMVQECRETRDALMEHRRQHHSNLADLETFSDTPFTEG